MVIFTEEKRYADAERYGLVMLSEYPDNRLILWNLKTVYEQWQRTDKLKNIIVHLLQCTMESEKINRYTEADCRLKLAQIKIKENNRSEAEEELKKVIALQKYIGKTKGDLRKKINKAEELLETVK
jgi:Flp pilus assembly protein TadD